MLIDASEPSAMFSLLFSAAVLAAPLDNAPPSRQEPPAVVRQAPFDGLARLNDAIAKVRAVAFRADSVEWEAVTPTLQARAGRATSAIDMLPVYRDLLAALGDGHSFVQADAALLDDYARSAGEPIYVKRTGQRASAFVGRETVSAEDVAVSAGRARIVVAPAMMGGGARANANANALFGAVTQPGEICGYVIDLRGNTGGNVWPMLVGLSPLLGEGLFGVERDREGRDTPYARISSGAAVVLDGEYQGMTLVQADRWRAVDATDSPVAVLIDDATASSGEGVAVAFQGRPLTRTFGQTSYGVASSNLGVPVADDINLVVTTAMMVDRLGRIHPDGVAPDEMTSVEDALPKALAWLGRQAACADDRGHGGAFHKP